MLRNMKIPREVEGFRQGLRNLGSEFRTSGPLSDWREVGGWASKGRDDLTEEETQTV